MHRLRLFIPHLLLGIAIGAVGPGFLSSAHFCALSAQAAPSDDGKPRAIVPRGLPFESMDKVPNSISVIAGIPLTGGGDLSGGFGDVVSNVHMAKALKRKYPAARVQLVVELFDEFRYEVTSVEKIIRSVLPTVDTSVHFTAQIVDGVEIRIIPPLSYLQFEKAKRAGKIPICDLAVQYSANRSPREHMLEATGKTWFSFHEFGDILNNSSTEKRFGSGLQLAGVYPATPNRSVSESKAAITDWLARDQRINVNLEGATFGYAYTKDPETARDYQRAARKLAQKYPNKQFVIAVKRDAAFKTGGVKNLRILALDPFPLDIGMDLIAASDLPPLVTGDSSFSTALLTTRPERAFLYEVLPWKEYFVELTEMEFAKTIGSASARALFVPGLATSATPHTRVESILAAFEGSANPAKVHAYLTQARGQIDLAKNTLKIYRFLEQYGTEFRGLEHSYRHPFVNLLLEEWMGSENATDFSRRVSARMRAATNPVDVLEAAGLKLFVGEHFSPEEHRLFFSSLDELMVLPDWRSVIRVTEAYDTYLSRSSLFQSFLLESERVGTEAYRSRASLRRLWQEYLGQAQGAPTLEQAKTLACQANLAPAHGAPSR